MYNRDYLAQTADGSQQPMLNVFHRIAGYQAARIAPAAATLREWVPLERAC
jgi:hypothetical protein